MDDVPSDPRWEQVFYKLDRPLVSASDPRNEKERALRTVINTMADFRAQGVPARPQIFDGDRSRSTVSPNHKPITIAPRTIC